MHVISLILLLICALVSANQQVSLFIKSIEDESIQEIGILEDKGIYHYNPMVLDPQLGYCFGTNDLPNHECFSYTKGIKSLKSVQFHVFLDQASQIQHISVNYDSETNDNDGPQVIIHPFELAPSPNLNPESLKGKQKKESLAGQQRVEKVIQKKIIKVKDENGNEIEKEIEQEVEVEVDDRSWIQKNWMYIVPPLILFLMFSKDEPKK